MFLHFLLFLKVIRNESILNKIDLDYQLWNLFFRNKDYVSLCAYRFIELTTSACSLISTNTHPSHSQPPKCPKTNMTACSMCWTHYSIGNTNGYLNSSHFFQILALGIYSQPHVDIFPDVKNQTHVLSPACEMPATKEVQLSTLLKRPSKHVFWNRLQEKPRLELCEMH
jgi:hypothetical protein